MVLILNPNLIFMTQLRPLAGWVVVERTEKPAQTTSGFVLTESNKEKPQEGKVISVGLGKEGKEAQVKVGQSIVFKKYGPTEIEHEGKDYLLLEEDDILAVIE